jgi:type II restriction enzyme
VGVNLDKPKRWKSDIATSVDMYNDWFMRFAPQAFRTTRVQTTKDVESALRATGNMIDVRPEVLQKNPGILGGVSAECCFSCCPGVVTA